MKEVKYCADTRPGHQLEASSKRDSMQANSKLEMSHFTPFFMVWEVDLKHLALS